MDVSSVAVPPCCEQAPVRPDAAVAKTEGKSGSSEFNEMFSEELEEIEEATDDSASEPAGLLGLIPVDAQAAAARPLLPTSFSFAFLGSDESRADEQGVSDTVTATADGTEALLLSKAASEPTAQAVPRAQTQVPLPAANIEDLTSALAFNASVKSTPRDMDLSASWEKHGSEDPDSRGTSNLIQPGDSKNVSSLKAVSAVEQPHTTAFELRMSSQEASPSKEVPQRPAAETIPSFTASAVEAQKPELEESLGEQAPAQGGNGSQYHSVSVKDSALSHDNKAGKPESTTQTSQTSSTNFQELENKAAEPLRRMSFHIDGGDGQVRLRIAERGGELRAWVTGNNTGTIEKVQSELTDLTKALSATGRDTELWTPNKTQAGVPGSSPVATLAPDVQTSFSQNESGFDQGSQGRGDHRGDGRRGSHEQKQDEDPEQPFSAYARNYKWLTQ